jgi:hypothetical protein
MDLTQARVISASKDGKRAEVVIYVGEGSQRRSITRHVHLQSGQWVGRNPNDAALARLDEAERAFEKVKGQHETLKPLAKLSVKEIDKIIKQVRKHGKKARGIPNGFLDTVGSLVKSKVDAETIRVELGKIIKESAIALGVATRRVRKLRKEIPREVIFSTHD